jgi:GMP synthase (glutamine-hydrolysing)
MPRKARRCLALQHVAFEDLGMFAQVLGESGFQIDYRQAGVHPVMPDEWLSADLVVVLGGPIGAYETDKYPWLTAQIAGMRSRLDKQLPALGICLGAQLMAAAMGARVYAGAAKEIGWSPVVLTEAGKYSCLAHLQGVPVLHWHGDTFDLPEGAILLASTTRTQNQAFSIGDFALALQFHAEVETAAIEPWLIGHSCELAQANISVPLLRAQAADQQAHAQRAGRAMFSAWLAGQG